MKYYENIYELAQNNSKEDFLDLMSRDKKPLDEIIADEIIEISKMPRELVLSTKRDREIVVARQLVHYSLHHLSGLKLQTIADKYTSKSDHGIVLNSIHSIQDRIDTNDPTLYIYTDFLTRNNLMK